MQKEINKWGFLLHLVIDNVFQSDATFVFKISEELHVVLL